MRIYFIVIHQQQVEGLFNKLDLKTHPNMSLSMKQSKLRLSSSQIDKENLLERLKKMQANQQKTPLQELNLQQFGPEVASNIFNNLLN